MVVPACNVGNGENDRMIPNRNRFAAVVGVLFAFLTHGNLQAQEALDAVEKKLSDAWTKVRSLTAKATSESNFEGILVTNVGTLEYMSDRGRELVRLDVEMSRRVAERAVEVKTSMLYDGVHMYTTTDHGNAKVAAKQSPNNLNIAPGGRRFFALVKQSHVLRVLGEEKLEGEEVYVIEGRPRAPDPQVASVMKFYLSKSTGLRRKAVGTDGDGRVVYSSEYTNIKVDEPVSAERFKFEAPPDSEVIDATKPPLTATP